MKPVETSGEHLCSSVSFDHIVYSVFPEGHDRDYRSVLRPRGRHLSVAAGQASQGRTSIILDVYFQ